MAHYGESELDVGSRKDIRRYGSGLQIALQRAQVVSDLQTAQVMQKKILVLFYDYLNKAKDPHERPVPIDV
jgi:hypothetical protein